MGLFNDTFIVMAVRRCSFMVLNYMPQPKMHPVLHGDVFLFGHAVLQDVFVIVQYYNIMRLRVL